MKGIKKYNKIILLFSIITFISMYSIGCSSSSNSNDNKLVFRMAIVDGETSPIYKGAKAMADRVYEKTDGRIEILVVTGGALGDERGSVELAMQGDLDIASAANSVLTNWIPEMDILDQAYLWTNEKQAHSAVDGDLGQLISNAVEEKLGLHVIGYLESGFRDTFSKKSIEEIDDFKGIKIRTMQNKYHMAAFQSFGAMPTAMPYNEVFTALQQGTIDACENAVSNCLSNGYYEVTKDITLTHHAFTYIPVLMSDKAWNSIPEELRDEFMEGCKEGYVAQREFLAEANADAIEQLKEKGVEFHEVDTKGLKECYQKVASEKGFTFNPEWQAAVDKAISENP